MHYIRHFYNKNLVYESDHIICTKKELQLSGERASFFKAFRTKKELITYTQWKKCDWISLARGPSSFWNLSEQLYNLCLDIIKRGKIATYSRIYRLSDANKIKVIMRIGGAKKVYED